MVKSQYQNCWMPPQEGVNLGESFSHALERGLMEECDIEIRTADGGYHRGVYLRDIKYLATLDLPPERHGSRSIAGNVEDSLFSHITMKKKAYWTATVLAPSTDLFQPVPNLNEVADARWVPLDEAWAAIKSNRPEKTLLLEKAIYRGVQALYGVEDAELWRQTRSLTR